MINQTQTIRSPAYQDLYSNNSGMSLTPYDASLTFGRFVNFSGNQFIEELATIRFSPQQLAVLARSLSRASEAWQNEFGKIDIDNIPGLTVEQMGEGLKNIRAALKSQFEQIVTNFDSSSTSSQPQP